MTCDPREVFKTALLSNSSGIILVHNHPSGDTHPKPHDYRIAGRIRDAGQVLRVQLVDSVIVSPGRFVLFNGGRRRPAEGPSLSGRSGADQRTEVGPPMTECSVSDSRNGYPATPRIYVADLAAYNNGILRGEWIDADQDPDDIFAEIEAMLRNSPYNGEEFAIHDYDNFGGLSLSEWEDIPHVSRLGKGIAKYGSLYAAVIEEGYDPDDTEKLLTEGYHGAWDSIGDYVEEQVTSTSEIPQWLAYYIDWETMGSDWESNGDIFTVKLERQIHVFNPNC